MASRDLKILKAQLTIWLARKQMNEEISDEIYGKIDEFLKMLRINWMKDLKNKFIKSKRQFNKYKALCKWIWMSRIVQFDGRPQIDNKIRNFERSFGQFGGRPLYYIEYE